MGMDIHMRLMKKDGTVILKNVFEGHNSEWFNNLQNRGYDDAYNSLHYMESFKNSIPENTSLTEDLEKNSKDGYFGFAQISLEDYIAWFDEYRPDLDAGWFSTYEWWAYQHNRYNPFEEGLRHYREKDEIDMEFHEVIDKYNCDNHVIRTCEKAIRTIDGYILYWYFDW